jgi:hypothetical protein
MSNKTPPIFSIITLLATVINFKKNPDWVNNVGVVGIIFDFFIIISMISG